MDTKIIVALIAAFVSFIGLVISKEQKISEFRQEWINKLRIDISQLIGLLNLLTNKWVLAKLDSELNIELAVQFVNNNVETFKEINVMISRIRLSLNPKGDKGLLDILSKIEHISESPITLSDDDFLKDVNDLESECHKVFKTEWERVKRGEPIYRVVKFIIGVVTLCLLILIIAIIFKG